jgi:DNA-binding response OmpR family regulator
VLRVVSPGEGANPVVSVPVVPVVAAIVPAPVAAVVPAPMATPGPAGTCGRVLVVEDSPTITAVVKYFLELEGFEVFVAENGLVGLEMAIRERPDIIVSDVNMPGMGGVEMVRAVRGDARMAGVRIIMLTSESSIECETEGLAAGADDYILKPVEPRRLAARVKALRARSQVAVEGRKQG